jgi:ribonuclease HI
MQRDCSSTTKLKNAPVTLQDMTPSYRLRKLRAIGVQRCILCTDSKVVAGQIEKECIAREPTLKKYLALIRRKEKNFKGFTVEFIDRSKNAEANELAKAVA